MKTKKLKRDGKQVTVVYKPEGEQKRRYRKLKNGAHRTEPMRGKVKCGHRTYIRNRNGKVLRDPDTGHLAQIGCRKIARYFTSTMNVVKLDHEVGGFGGFAFSHVEDFCPQHYEERFGKF